MTVVVGGSGRKAGKTTVVCEIIAATPHAQWTAIKVTPHHPVPDGYGDTERFLEAGAARAFLVENVSNADLHGNVILESNSVMEWLQPDAFVFVDGGGEWKSSAELHVDKANYVVCGHSTPEMIAFISAGVARE